MNNYLLKLCALIGFQIIGHAVAEPVIAPGRIELRTDLQALADAGIITSPLTAWPISWQNVISDLESANTSGLSLALLQALNRIESEIEAADQPHQLLPHVRIGMRSDTASLRTFSTMSRDEGELEGGVSYTGDRLSFNVNLIRAFEGQDDWRADGSYVAFALNRWAAFAGLPERWWGPGIQGSLILSTNARPVPQVGIERISSEPFASRWLQWLGPWTLSTFIGELDDERVIENAKLFGIRLTARPLPQLEIGISRTAQLCGTERQCGGSEFTNMLLGKDNRGSNISDENEPGNQLGGTDGRWSFNDSPFAVYWQWIGEDTRQGGPQIGSWLRMAGLEVTGRFPWTNLQHRTWFEIADTTCQEGGIGYGGAKPNCAYQHSIYRTGYRLEGMPLGYPTDTDSESLAIVSVLSGAGTAYWELAARSARINQGPVALDQPHSLSVTPASLAGLDVAHVRDLALGRLRVRIGVQELKDSITGVSTRDSNIALEWMLGYW